MAAACRIFIATAFVLDISQNAEAFALQNLILIQKQSSLRLVTGFPRCGKYLSEGQNTRFKISAVSLNSVTESLVSKDNSVMASNTAPHLVILPGFGNADVDYKDPFGAGLDRSILHALTTRGFQVNIMPLKVTILFSIQIRMAGIILTKVRFHDELNCLYFRSGTSG